MSSSKPLVENCQADVGTIENDVNDLKQRWDNICGVLQEAQEKFPKMKEAVEMYEESARPLVKCIEQGENVVINTKPFGMDADKGEELLNTLKVFRVVDEHR